MLYWLVNLVNNHTISRKGFLKELTWISVTTNGIDVGFSKYSGRTSKPLLSLFIKSLQSSPLKVSVGCGSFNILRKTCGDREMGERSWSCIILWIDTYFSTHYEKSSLQLNTSGTHLARAIPNTQITSFCARGEE